VKIRSKIEPRQIELAGALHRRQRDREILDREPGRVEDGDVAVRVPTSYWLTMRALDSDDEVRGLGIAAAVDGVAGDGRSTDSEDPAGLRPLTLRR